MDQKSKLMRIVLDCEEYKFIDLGKELYSFALKWDILPLPPNEKANHLERFRTIL